ncbi:plasmid mobilization protein [Endozoicomonas ascidiicola]|uniref:plasmid mobilization protein n=1 Tax=Endozoicomonas ascidiicola TaxID=1698521 RepID=UPI00082D38FC|nr:hypothetical protein [Endozoicomonas ascidiicola]
MENRETQIQLRTSFKEKKDIKASATALNLDVSSYIRALHAQKELPPPPSALEQKQLVELSRIGNMFNELVTLVRTGNAPDTTNTTVLIETMTLFIKYMEAHK